MEKKLTKTQKWVAHKMRILSMGLTNATPQERKKRRFAYFFRAPHTAPVSAQRQEHKEKWFDCMHGITTQQ